MKNEERVVLLTGSSSGLGATMTKHFASKGFGVVMNYVVESDAEKAYEELLQITDESKVMKYKADVTNREQVKAMFDEAVKKFGKVDILINFAGINRDAPFIELTDEQWDSVVSIHLKGHFICSQQYALHNPDREGVIINLGAACGQIGRKNGANFCSAKAGIIALTKCMALELAPRIRVNCLVPGSIKTREVIDRYDLETEEGLAKELVSLPMNRLGEFEDVTHIIDCMIDAKFTTGANFYVNGGQYMH